VVELLLGRAGVWLAGMLVVVAAFGTGYIKGKVAEQDKQKLAAAEVVMQRIKTMQTVYVNDGRVSEAYEKGRREREDEFNKTIEDLKRSQVAAMPASCDLPDDVIRLLNSSRSDGRSSSDSGKPSDPMQRATGATGR